MIVIVFSRCLSISEPPPHFMTVFDGHQVLSSIPENWSAYFSTKSWAVCRSVASFPQ